MSTRAQPIEHPGAGTDLQPPFFGALLRLAWQDVRDLMHQAIHEAGFTDFQDAHFAIFSYPLPDGIRPSELARQKKMSRQAMNYLIVQLEELGYVERHAPEGGERRLVYLSPRGKQVAEVIFAFLRRLQVQWSDEIGHERFDTFLGVLKQLASRAPQEASKAD